MSDLEKIQSELLGIVYASREPKNFLQAATDALSARIIPHVGSYLRDEIKSNQAQSQLIDIGVNNNIPGYGKHTEKIGGRDITIRVDAVNPDDDPVVIVSGDGGTDRDFKERYADEIGRITDAAVAQAMGPRDAILNQPNGEDVYSQRMQNFMGGLMKALFKNMDNDSVQEILKENGYSAKLGALGAESEHQSALPPHRLASNPVLPMPPSVG